MTLPAAAKRATLLRFDDVFGLGLAAWAPKQRSGARRGRRARAGARRPRGKAKQWAEADRLRAELHAAGWEMEDRADGYALKRRS